MFFGKKKNPHDTGCFVCHIVVTVLFFIATVVSAVGAILAHYNPTEELIIFGSMSGSLSLMAFVLCTTLWMRSMKACMMGCEVCGTNGKK